MQKEIEKIASFDCGYEHNAVNIAIALAKAGRFVNIRQDGTTYVVDVYKQK